MKIFSIVILSLFFFSSSQACSMKKYLWKNRILVVNKGAEAESLKIQKQKFKKEEVGARERDLLLIFKEKACNDEAVEFNFKAGEFKAHLIGKDGGIKATYNKPVEMKKVFAEIDSMPMRQQEMKNGQD
jgi:hypothetical protein